MTHQKFLELRAENARLREAIRGWYSYIANEYQDANLDWLAKQMRIALYGDAMTMNEERQCPVCPVCKKVSRAVDAFCSDQCAQAQSFATGNLAIDRAEDSRRTVYLGSSPDSRARAEEEAPVPDDLREHHGEFGPCDYEPCGVCGYDHAYEWPFASQAITAAHVAAGDVPEDFAVADEGPP